MMIIQVDRGCMTTQIRDVDKLRIRIKCSTCKAIEWRTVEEPFEIKCKCHYERELKHETNTKIEDDVQSLIDYYSEQYEHANIQLSRVLDQIEEG